MSNSTGAAFMHRHASQFYQWMLKRPETKEDVKQEIDLAIFLCGQTQDKAVIRECLARDVSKAVSACQGRRVLQAQARQLDAAHGRSEGGRQWLNYSPCPSWQ